MASHRYSYFLRDSNTVEAWTPNTITSSVKFGFQSFRAKTFQSWIIIASTSPHRANAQKDCLIKNSDCNNIDGITKWEATSFKKKKTTGFPLPLTLKVQVLGASIKPTQSHVSNFIELQHCPGMGCSVTHPKRPSKNWFHLCAFAFLVRVHSNSICKFYSNCMRRLKMPWDTVKTNAENVGLRTTPWGKGTSPPRQQLRACQTLQRSAGPVGTLPSLDYLDGN